LREKNKSEKEAKKRKVGVHLLATNALVIFWRSVFCNTTSTTSFWNTASTPFLQHCFNIAFATLSSAVAFQHRFYSIVFYNIVFVLEWRRGSGFLVGQR
jgi:hypothetical protein